MHIRKRTTAFLTIAAIVAAIISAPTTSPATGLGVDELSFYISPNVGYSLGKTEYILDYSAQTVDGLVSIKSQLEFPLDVIMAGGTIGMVINPNTDRPWRLEATLMTNVNDPGGKMFDHDWGNVWFTGPLDEYRKLSYTESDAEMSSLMAEFQIAKRLARGSKLGIWGLAGIRYFHIKQDVIGFTGWQYDPVGDTVVNFSIAGTKGIEYEVTYWLPQVGIRLDWYAVPRMTLFTEGLFTPAIISDRDDHVLRFKESTSSITGWGLIGSAGLSFDLSPAGSPGAFLELFGEYSYQTASGSETQRWYDDETIIDPNTGEEIVLTEAGTEISRIPHDIHLYNLQLTARMGYRF